MIRACERQIRVAPSGGVFGLDMGAVFTMAGARGVSTELLADVLPDVERAVIAHYRRDEE